MVSPVTKVKYNPSPRGQRSSQVIRSPNTSCNRKMLDKMGHTTNKVRPSSRQNVRRIVLLIAPFSGVASRTRAPSAASINATISSKLQSRSLVTAGVAPELGLTHELLSSRKPEPEISTESLPYH